MPNNHPDKESISLLSEFIIQELTGLARENEIVPLKEKYNSFILITGGDGILQIDFDEFIALENRVFFIEKYKIWSWNRINKVRGVLIQFTDSFYNHIYTGNPKIRSDQSLFGEIPPFITIRKVDKNEWKSICGFLFKEYSAARRNSREIICLALKVLMLMYRRNSQIRSVVFESRQKRELLNDFRKLVNNRFRTLRTAKDYAHELNITPNYLNALCQEYFYKTVTAIIQERVILEAKRLLMHSRLSISEIAYNLGFKDNSYFGRYFKKAAGMTPDTFRSQYYYPNQNK